MRFQAEITTIFSRKSCNKYVSHRINDIVRFLWPPIYWMKLQTIAVSFKEKKEKKSLAISLFLREKPALKAQAPITIK